LGVLPIYC